MSGIDIVPQSTLHGNGSITQAGSHVVKLFSVQSLLWLALLLALAGSLRHLAAMFASIDGSLIYGYLSAVAVDAGLFSLSYSLRQRKAAKRGIFISWVGIVLFTAISVYGNYAYGLMASGAALPGWILVSRPVVMAASLPILVLYLAELISDNQHFTAAQAANPGHLAADPPAVFTQTVEQAADPGHLATHNAEAQATKQNRIAQLATLLEDNPQATNTELAKLLEVSRGTIRNYRAALNGNGRVRQ